MIRYATSNDTNSVKRLFNMVFDEDLAFNKYFFENVFKEEYALIYQKDDSIIAMLMEIPYFLEGVGAVTYIYGVATDPAYRKQGYMTQLLDYCHRNLTTPSVLIPASKQLFDFYSKYGYRTGFYREKKTFEGKGASVISPASPSIEKINDIYEKGLKNIPHIKRDISYWKRQFDMLDKLSGGVLYFENIGYCIYWLGDEPEIQELFALENKYADEICNYFCHNFNVDKVDYSSFGNEAFGMIRGSEEIKGYMNMMFN